MTTRNLVIIHLESVAWRTLQAFPEAFPNFNRLMPESRVYRSYFSSATSTQMVLAYLFHGNDCEMDAAPGLTRPAANNPSLFSTLGKAGYRTEFLGVTARPGKPMLPLFTETLTPVWSTNDFGALLQRFDEATNADRFALYVWNLATHVEHAMALASHAEGLDDLIGGACAVADHALGAMIDVLERKSLIDDTALVIFGDHGDDYWTHGFKKGLLHGVEPHTQIVHCPLLIRDASLPAGTDHDLASTIDLAATCFDLLGVAPALPFVGSGRSLVSAPRRRFAFSQNFTASQPDAADMDIRKAFSVHDASHTLMASSRGLELYNHRLDPGNHCNLLHFFDLDRDGALRFQDQSDAHSHFATAVGPMLCRDDTLRNDFERLRAALRNWLAGKQDYVAARATPAQNTLDPTCLDRINRHGRESFFGGAAGRGGRRSAAIRRHVRRFLQFLLRRSDHVRP